MVCETAWKKACSDREVRGVRLPSRHPPGSQAHKNRAKVVSTHLVDGEDTVCDEEGDDGDEDEGNSIEVELIHVLFIRGGWG